jgi:predicted porin
MIRIVDVVDEQLDPEANWDVFNNSSRLGVRGEEDLGGGLSAIYQYEFGVDVTEGGNFNSNRPKWVGLKGSSWGAVTLGTQWTPYYNVHRYWRYFQQQQGVQFH